MLVSTADDGKVVVWDPKTAQPLQALLGHAGRPTQSAFSADGRTLYTSSLDGTVLEWDLGSQRRFGRPFTTGATPAPTPSPTTPLTPPLAVSPDGSQFAAQTAAGSVGIFATRTLQKESSVSVPHAGTVTTVAWSPAGSELAVGGDHGLLQLWDVSGAPHRVRELSTLRSAGHRLEAVQSVAFSADGRLIAASDLSQPQLGAPSGHIALWRTHTGAPVTASLKLAAPGNDIAFSRDGRLLAVALGDGRVLVLDSSTGTKIRTIHPLRGANGGTVSLAFAPNGTLATGTYAGVVQLWNPSTGARIRHPVLVGAAPVTSIAFDRSGERFATAGGPEGGLKLWFTTTLQQDGATLDPEQGTSGNSQFTPNGQLLLAVNANGHGSLWPVNPAAWANHACAVAGRNLTHEEWSRFITGYRYTQVCP
jgi:WD40 repeat protein